MMGMVPIGFMFRFFIKGETVFLATCTAKPTGSVCQIRNTGTTLDGVNLYIDAGSVTDPIEVQVSLNTGYLRLHDGTVYKNPIIEIMIDKNAKLKHPIKIAIPISLGEDSDPISGFFIKDDGSLSAVVSTPSVTYEDKIRRFSIYTFHSGMFTWIGGRL